LGAVGADAGFGARMGWDAFYVGLAETFDATLLVMDERLARAHEPTCRIEVLGVAVIVVGSSPESAKICHVADYTSPFLRAR